MAQGRCPDYPQTPCRVNLELMPEGTVYWMYGLTALAFVVFGYGIWQMVHVWRMGRPWQAGDWRKSLARLVVAVGTHRKLQKEPKPGTSHAWVFFGFLVLFIGTTLAFIDMDIFELIMKSKLLYGPGYLVYELALDFFAIVFIMGVSFLMWRRYVERPPQLHRTQTYEAPRLRWLDVDMHALVFLLLIGVTGLLMEGMRLRHQVRVDGIEYAQWSFAGNMLANTVFWRMSEAQIATWYPALWWFHFALWSAILAILPWTKLRHILTTSLNIYFHDPERQARPALPTPFSLEEVMSSGQEPQVGYTTIRDLTWKDRLALDACMNCGRCEAQCPATAAGRPLSPRKLIQDLKSQMWADYRAEKALMRANPGQAYAPAKLTEIPETDMRQQIQEATLWSCTTCRACMSECPANIEHVDIITEIRRGLVMESKLDEHKQKLLVNLTNAGNPYGFPAADRADWTNGLHGGIRVPLAAEKVGRGESFEYLWWVGCVGSYDPRNQKVTQAFATILNAAGVDFAILGPQERCNGDPARRLGEEGRFQQSVMENLAVLQEVGASRIITQCPHCFNTLANEYPEFGAKFTEVVHHTQFIERLIDEGRLPLKDGAEMKITYHDSCYLGRHNGIFDAPRRVLQKANNGLPVLEMSQSGERGMCCGAGGSNMWYEVKQEQQRINVIRAKQARETGADSVVSACPFCLTMLKDGIGLTGSEDDMLAEDLAEVVVRNLDWQPPEPAEPEAAEPGAASQESVGWVG